MPVKSLTVTREAADGGVKQTTTGEQTNGTAINASYTAKYDGKDVPVTGKEVAAGEAVAAAAGGDVGALVWGPLQRQPLAILESFLLLMQHQELRGMTAPTLRALYRARRRIDARLRKNEFARLMFVQILQPVFTLPPDRLSFPADQVLSLAALGLGAMAASALAAGAVLRRLQPMALLREE